MLITSLKRHFPARFPEWLNAGILFSWGVYVSLHPELFTHPATHALWEGMREVVSFTPYDPAAVWGLIAVSMGFVRAAALFINGAFTRTPAIRLLMSFGSAFIWTQVVIGFMKSEVPNTGIILYAWLVVADIASAYRASQDMTFAAKQRQDNMETGGRVDPRSNFA